MITLCRNFEGKPTHSKTDYSGCLGIQKHIQIAFLFLSAIFSTQLAAEEKKLEEQLVKDHTQFAFSLFSALETRAPNRVYSPYSVASCLSMVVIGARGNTETEMLKALQLNIDRKELPKAAHALRESLFPKPKVEDNYQLNIANALWVDQGTFLLADFRYAVEDQFKAKLSLTSFAQPEAAIKTINAWTSQETQGKIGEIITANDVNPETRIVLTNALYFQGSWLSPFDQKNTMPAAFFQTPDLSKQTLMMSQTNLLPYYENDLMQAVALPFKGISNNEGRLAYLIFLPKSADNFDAMLQEMPRSFSEWLGALSMRRVLIKMPKFTLSNRFDLNASLQNLGMEDAFNSEANFNGIDGMRDLMLSKVVHQAYFALDEKGVSAAAATAASINVTSLRPSEPPLSFVADHPFLFFIVDLKSREVLFLGKFEQPGAL